MILEVLENKALNARLRQGARRYAEENLAMGTYISAYRAAIERMTGMEIEAAEAAPRKRVAAGKKASRPQT